ncbi:MAG: GMC family oxidoreductase N-terminal domain-containing protein [Gammaproteobacteria bacterium]|nr:GMC family oxidoreductase N-terminal domain-containing protein [Gammaproteobacteria bacterium]
MDEHDYVIAGAGPAGCVLAYRLAAQGHSVCVLEAGPSDTSPYIRMPAGFMKTYDDPALTWRFTYRGTPNTYDRDVPFVQGRTLGGSSALNGTIYSRGQACDYDHWASLGNPGWDYASVLPYFRRNECFMGEGDDAYRGREGRLLTDVIQRRNAVCDAFIQAALETGSPPNPDYNGRSQTGTCYAQATVYKGRRCSAAHAYLHPARRQFGVRVLTHALVRRIVFEGGRAAGVEYLPGGRGEPRTVRARLCTIVSTGTINTVKLLQLSGIGPAERLQELGIPVVADLPGVGENLNDHYAARVVARARPGVDTVNGRGRGPALLGEIAAWLLGRPSILGMSVVSAYAFCKLAEDSPANDFTVTFTPASFKEGMTRKLDDFPGVTVGAWIMRPRSRGFVRVQSGDIHAAPIVQPNHLDAEHDRMVMVAALKRVSAIVKSKAMAHIVDRQIFPREPCESDAERLEFVRRHGLTTYHYAGTARMGPESDRQAVVDPRLCVRNVPGLRVVDASVMPTVPSGNTNAATLMIAEKAADMILADHAR